MERFSDAIRIARVLCIFTLMFVHVYSGFKNFPVMTSFGPEDVFYHLMTDVFGRASVPLLTIISGWLFARHSRPYGATLRKKATSLLLPMVIWNLIALFAIAVYATSTLDHSDLPRGAMGWVNAEFALTTQPANEPLGFLRDLFVVTLLSPLVVGGLRVSKGWLLAPLFALAVLLPQTVVLLRTQILLFFAVGVFLQQINFRKIPTPVLCTFACWSLGSFVLRMWLLADGGETVFGPLHSNLDRIAIAGLTWQAACSLVGRRAGTEIARLEPYAFLAFCSHFLVFGALSVIGVRVFGDLRSPLYPVYFVLQPILAFVAAVAIAHLLRPLPAVLRALNAGRLPEWGKRDIDFAGGLLPEN